MTIGAIAGTLSGLFGVGGGILIVPALVMVLGMSQRLAHGTSLAATMVIAPAGMLGYAIDGSIDLAAAVLLAIGAATIGAWLGTTLLHRLPQAVLVWSFGGVLLLTALRMVFETEEGSGRGALSLGLVLGLVAIGLLSGLSAGLLGVGGGIIMVPAMVILFGFPAAVAKGTSLLVIIPTSLTGTIRNLKKRNCNIRLALGVGATGAVTSFVGSQVSLGLDDGLSNALFAVLLLLLALRLVVTHMRRPTPAL